MKWKFFGAACVLMGYLMNALGAPMPAIIAGIALSIAWNIVKSRERRA